MLRATQSRPICVEDRMNTQPTAPTYLPAVNRQLEYQAGLLTNTARPVATTTAAAPVASNRLWLGADFTHIVVAR
jgi:hypothetical protein